MISTEQLNKFEDNLEEIVLKIAKDKGFVEDRFFEVEELVEKWKDIAPEYMVDGVREFNQFPSVAIAWVAYVGMGVAAMWDGDWDKFKDNVNLYQELLSKRGFDQLDEYVVEDVYGINLDSEQNKGIENLFLSCSKSTISLMRNENIEPQTADAFYVFSRANCVFFKLGVSVGLKILGYEYKKMTVPMGDLVV